MIKPEASQTISDEPHPRAAGLRRMLELLIEHRRKQDEERLQEQERLRAAGVTIEPEIFDCGDDDKIPLPPSWASHLELAQRDPLEAA